MPLFLFWYILRDLLKLLFISTAVLVSVISFGAAIQPLSEGLIGPVRLMVFILLAMPPMLQFALPFSAAFSATIVYHRMAQDNELSACAVSGVSYLQLLLPAATLGVILTISLSLLTNYVCPRFWREMSNTARLDAPEFFMRSIEHDDPIEAGNLLIRARGVQKVELPADSQAYASMRVFGLVVMILEKGQVEAIGTAPQGVFNLTRVGSDTVVTSVFDQLVVINQDNDDLLRTKGSQLEPWVIPSAFRDSPKFMDLNELHRISASPQFYWRVKEKIDVFRMWLAKRQLYVEMEAQLSSTGRGVLVGYSSAEEGGSGLRMEIFGSGLGPFSTDGWKVLPPAGSSEVRVVKYKDGPAQFEVVSREVVLEPKLDSMLMEPSLAIHLEKPIIQNLATGVKTELAQASFSALFARKKLSATIRDLPVGELVDLAVAYGDSGAVRSLSREINEEIAKVGRNIQSRIHERTALSVSCLGMLLLGAVLAIRMRTALPLTVYFMSFLPSIVGLILISTGADLLREVDDPVWVGTLVAWSGNLIMAIFVAVILRKVTRT